MKTIKVQDHMLIPSGVYRLKIDDDDYEEFDEKAFLRCFDSFQIPKANSHRRMLSMLSN